MSNSHVTIPKYLLWGILALLVLIFIYSTTSSQAKPPSQLPSSPLTGEEVSPPSEEASTTLLEQSKTSTIPISQYKETLLTVPDECRSPKLFLPNPSAGMGQRNVIYVACTAGGGILRIYQGSRGTDGTLTKLNTLPQCDVVHDIQVLDSELHATCGTPDNLIIVRIDFAKPIPGLTPDPISDPTPLPTPPQ